MKNIWDVIDAQSLTISTVQQIINTLSDTSDITKQKNAY